MQVKRYPICYTNREQSVAEHSYNVLLIARDLAGAAKDQDILDAVTDYAIEHDEEEVFTGDIPSSFKRELREHCPDVIPLLDGKKRWPAEVKAIVKLADLLEAIYYLREFGGSRLSGAIADDIEEKFRQACQTLKVPPKVVQRAEYLWKTL